MQEKGRGLFLSTHTRTNTYFYSLLLTLSFRSPPAQPGMSNASASVQVPYSSPEIRVPVGELRLPYALLMPC